MEKIIIYLHRPSEVLICPSCGVVALISFQGSADGEQSGKQETEMSGSGGGGLSALSGSSSKLGSAPSVYVTSLSSEPIMKLDPQNPPAPAQSYNPPLPNSSLSNQLNIIGPFLGLQDSGSSVSEADKKKTTVSLL